MELADRVGLGGSSGEPGTDSVGAVCGLGPTQRQREHDDEGDIYGERHSEPGGKV